MSYVILFCILIGHINADSTAADTNPYMNHAVDGILPMKNGDTTELQSRDGADPQSKWASGCKGYGCSFEGKGRNKLDKRLVVDGKVVEPPNKYPWVVGITTTGSDRPLCGGAIINEYFILTAAHCFERPGSDEWEIIFLSNSTDITKGVRLPVDKLFPHPEYRADGESIVLHDIGLMKMKKPIQYSEFAKPICLPPQNYRHPTGSVVGINGWGETENSKEGSPQLLEAQIWIEKDEKCKKSEIDKKWKKYAYCLSGREQSPCNGDSGGSMIAEIGNKYYALGVTSGGLSGDCATNAPVVYTSVSAYMDWITEVTDVVSSK